MITLEQAKVGMADKVDQAVIDEFRRGSYLLDRLIFDNAVSPGTAGSTLTYGYVKLLKPATAKFRKLNEEYTANEATREKASADLKIFGGEFALDRVIINKAAINLFHYTVINGDSSVNEDEFNGLAKLLKGSTTEFDDVYSKTADKDIVDGKKYFTRTGEGTKESPYVYEKVDEPNKTNIATYYEVSYVDLSTSKAMDDNYNEFLDMMNDFIATMQGKPDMFLVNSKMATKMKGVARRAGYFSRQEDAFGRSVDMWDGIPIVDLKEYFDGETTKTCVPIDEDGYTSIYAVQIAKDGFHGVSPAGNNVISTALPNLKEPGVIKKGDVEMVSAVVLKNTLKAGVFKNVKIQ